MYVEGKYLARAISLENLNKPHVSLFVILLMARTCLSLFVGAISTNIDQFSEQFPTHAFNCVPEKVENLRHHVENTRSQAKRMCILYTRVCTIFCTHSRRCVLIIAIE